MADFNKGNATDLKNNTAQYAEGSYVSADRILVVEEAERRGSRVFRSSKKVTVRTVTAFTRGQSDGKVKSATTLIYALDPKEDKWQPVGISRDGMSSIQLTDPQGAYPLVGGEGAQNVPNYEQLSEGLQDNQNRSNLQVVKNLEDSVQQSTVNGAGGGSFDENVLASATTAERKLLLASYRGAEQQEADPEEQDASRPVPNPAGNDPQVFSSPIFSSTAAPHMILACGEILS